MKLKVLIVDDSSYNLFVLEELLHEIDGNIEIIQAMNGREAIDKVQSADNLFGITSQFSLIIMDLNMPVMDGFLVSYLFNKDYRQSKN